jgi:hypothetical protein
MLDIAEIITHLKASCPQLNGNVFGSAELGAVQVQSQSMPTPCAFVLQEDEAVKTMTLDGSQLRTANFIVVISVRNVVDGRGQSAHLQLKPIADALILALHNWKMAQAQMPTSYIKARRLSNDNLLLNWAFMFESSYFS